METGVLLRLIRDNWLITVVLAVLGAAAGFGVAHYQPPQYEGSSQLFVSVASSSTTGDLAQGSDYAQQQASNYAEVATREFVLRPVIAQLHLDMTVPELRKTITTSVPVDTSVITITATDGSSQRAAAIANAVAESLVKGATELAPTISGSKDSPVKLRVIESALPSSTPSAPSIPLYVFLGFLAGLAVSVIVMVIREYVGTAVQSKEQLADVTGASVLGTIRQDRHTSKHPMALLHDPQSGRSEDIRQLRASLRFLQTDEDHQALVITSSDASEGKSTVAANVAAAIAASGNTVCLVEADLRRPSLGTLLDLVDGVGLTTVLAGEADIEDALQDWGDDGLQVMLAGEIPPNPGELLESAHMERVLDELTSNFDVTIIDCPPLNPVSDAAVLAAMFDGAILVSAARKVKVRDIRRAVDRLDVLGTPVLGAVLNMAPARRGGYYGSGGHYRPKPATTKPIRPQESTAPTQIGSGQIEAARAESADPDDAANVGVVQRLHRSASGS